MAARNHPAAAIRIDQVGVETGGRKIAIVVSEDAAARHPALLATDFAGSGSYADKDVADERFWAAAEVLAKTDDTRYRAIVETSLDYAWGSNAVLLNRAMLLGGAWQIAGKPAYRDAVIDVMDYILGRNALDRSYVTGFGLRRVHQPHHRFWANAADQHFPAPPGGVLVGGPNSTAMTDRIAAPMKRGCTGQTCWSDDWRAFTMNEVAINWNAPLVWVAAYLDATAGRCARARRRPAGA